MFAVKDLKLNFGPVNIELYFTYPRDKVGKVT